MVYVKAIQNGDKLYEAITEEEYVMLLLSGKYKVREEDCKWDGCSVCGGGDNRTLVPVAWEY